MAGSYKIENFYEPGYQSFSPSGDSPYLGKNNFIPAHQLGLTTDPSTANQIAALSQALNQGISVMEIGNLDQNIFETIPKQHFAEMRRKAKLAGAQLTMHAPIRGTDPSGFGERGYDEMNRLAVEKHLKDVIDKAAEMDDKGNMPITIHGSNTYGSTFKYIEDENGRRKVMDQLIAVDRETGEIRPLKEEVRYYAQPIKDEKTNELRYVSKKNYSPEEQMKIANTTLWEDQIDKIIFQKVNVDNIISKIPENAQMMALRAAEDSYYFNSLAPDEKNEVLSVQSARSYLEDVHKMLSTMFSRAYEFGNDNQKKELLTMSKDFAKDLYGVDPEKMVDGKLTEEEKSKMYYSSNSIRNQANAMQVFAEKLKEMNPNMLESIEKFSTEKASETFSNVALHAYDLKKDKAPALSLENLYQGMGFSQGEDLKNLVLASRDSFEKKLMKERHLSESEAKRISEKLIGVTFDVGHLNMSRKYGFTEKELVEEAKPLGKFVNKVHLTDNFGFNDTHLPPGMGNVPIRALVEALGDKAAKAIKINEVGGWFQQFKSSPFPQILEAYGSPIYSSTKGPYWSQAGGFQQSYMEGYGQMLPHTNYQVFGAGFSQLPQSLGGSFQQGSGGRMGGGEF